MSLRQGLPTNRNAEADRTTYTSNVTTTPTHNLSGRDPIETRSSLTDTLDIAEASEVTTTKYIYYRIYTEDGAIPSKTPAALDDPFLGRIKARSVPPPHTAKSVKYCIAKMENIKDRSSTSLFLTPYSQSSMGDGDKVAIFNPTGPGSTPREPLTLVAKMSDSERSALESGGRGELAGAASDTTPPEIRYLYYLLYADGSDLPSKVATDPEEPSLGRIRADSVAPPHSPTSIKRCISRVEGTSFYHADLFEDILCDIPLKEGHISILRTDGPGLSPNKPMAIVIPVPAVESPIPDGKYLIKNRAADIYWAPGHNPIRAVYFTTTRAKSHLDTKWDITHDTSGNIFMTSPYAPSSWVGADIAGSAVAVPWRLIPADSGSYYLTTDINRVSHNPRVPAAEAARVGATVPGSMATLKEGDQWQMWEFIRI